MKEFQENRPNALKAWEFTTRTSVEPPVYGGTIIDRFARSSKKNPVTLFVPWGASPTRASLNIYDTTALDWIQWYGEQLRLYDVPNSVMIMPADVYAVDINGDDPDRVMQYFSAVSDAAADRGFSVRPWSDIRNQYREGYDSVIRWECSPQALWQSTPKSLWYTGLLPAALARNQGRPDAAQTAFCYLQERVAEARIIDDVFAPVKLSMVSKQKDDVVDRELPRVYVIQKELRFPWLKGDPV